MSPTIRDVASKASVSFQLAAAVLGRRKYAHASESTRKRIISAAQELGYVPNASARILRGDASKIIGVMIDSRAPESMYGILAEIEHEAGKYGYRLLIAQAHDNPEKLLTSYRSLKQSGVDGIISFSHDYANLNCHLDELLQNDPKIVFVLNAGNHPYSAVDIDIVGGMNAAVEHLCSAGYRKPALLLVGSPERLNVSLQQRVDGFLSSCPGGKIIYLRSRMDNIPGLENEYQELIRKVLNPEKIDSVIALNDNFAAVLMKQLLSEGIRIPEDFGLIGCDNLMICECLPVKLTSLYYDRTEIGCSVLKNLLDKIAGKTDPVKIKFPLTLIVRDSTKKNMNIKIPNERMSS